MDRRKFLEGAVGASLLATGPFAHSFIRASDVKPASVGADAGRTPAAMSLGLMIQPVLGPEATIAMVKQLGFTNCFFSLDAYIGRYTPTLARDLKNLLEKYQVTATAAEVVGPGRLRWDFVDGPSTIGLIPKATRVARIDALKQTSDFAKMVGIPLVQTHCGFIPENPREPLYDEGVLAIRELAEHCAGNGQHFLMETGQETPTTMLRAIKDVDRPNVGVGLDTANLILYGKANPVDALDIIGPYVQSIHAKDGRWPTDPKKLGEEVVIGQGLVDFKQVFTKLRRLGYAGAITIERETSGPQQVEDVKQEKIYLERILAQV